MSLWTQLLSYKLHIHSVLIALTLKGYFTQKLKLKPFFFLFCWTQIHILNNVCVTKRSLLLQSFFILHVRKTIATVNCLFTKTLQNIIFCVEQKWEIDSAWGWVNNDRMFFLGEQSLIIIISAPSALTQVWSLIGSRFSLGAAWEREQTLV